MYTASPPGNTRRFSANLVKEIVGRVWYWIIAGIAVGALLIRIFDGMDAFGPDPVSTTARTSVSLTSISRRMRLRRLLR